MKLIIKDIETQEESIKIAYKKTILSLINSNELGWIQQNCGKNDKKQLQKFINGKARRNIIQNIESLVKECFGINSCSFNLNEKSIEKENEELLKYEINEDPQNQDDKLGNYKVISCLLSLKGIAGFSEETPKDLFYQSFHDFQLDEKITKLINEMKKFELEIKSSINNSKDLTMFCKKCLTYSSIEEALDNYILQYREKHKDKLGAYPKGPVLLS
jgi:translation initiation factor 2 beta subunit (eIF-2beta)/eIF-5